MNKLDMALQYKEYYMLKFYLKIQSKKFDENTFAKIFLYDLYCV